MQETFKMMKRLLTGKEEQKNEIELIEEYKRTLCPNILAYFYCNNFGLITNIGILYPVITNDDKASFCLQELDKSLQNFDTSKNLKFITYFSKCYKNRLRTEVEYLLTQKRKTILNCCQLTDKLDKQLNYINQEYSFDFILSNYNLSEQETLQCRLLNFGYSLKEIANILKVSTSTIYKRNCEIRQKILKTNINFA